MTTSSRPLDRLLQVALVAVLVLGVSPAHADVHAAAEELKACVLKHVDKEQARPNPKAENLLNICKKELEALRSLLPEGTELHMEQHLLQDIKDQLAKS